MRIYIYIYILELLPISIPRTENLNKKKISDYSELLTDFVQSGDNTNIYIYIKVVTDFNTENREPKSVKVGKNPDLSGYLDVFFQKKNI